MPNGHDKNWIRLCAAIDGFRLRHGCWPKRVLLYPGALDDLRNHLFSPQMFATIEVKVSLVAADAGMIAEDDNGNSYNYGTEGFPEKTPSPSAAEWLGVEPI